LAEFGSPEGGGTAPTPPGDGYWDRLLQPAVPVWAAPATAAPVSAVPAGPAPPSERQSFLLDPTPIAGYLGLLVAAILLTAIDNRDGSRWYFAGAALMVVLIGALLYWWRSQFAPMRVDLVDNGRTLLVITRRRTTPIPVASLISVRPDASALAQFFAWQELTVHHVGGRIRIGRPRETAEFYWQLGRSNPTLPPEPPPTEHRPWIVAVAIGLVLLGVVGSLATGLVAITSLHLLARILGWVALLFGLAQLGSCFLLWAGYRGAWRFFMVLAVAGGILGLIWTRYRAGSLASELVLFAALTSPGVRRWASG
jgi:hypothetical protein